MRPTAVEKIVVRDNDKHEYVAYDYEELVQQLNWFDQTPEDYMQGVALRLLELHGTRIEFSNAREFIQELVRIGILDPVSNVEVKA